MKTLGIEESLSVVRCLIDFNIDSKKPMITVEESDVAALFNEKETVYELFASASGSNKARNAAEQIIIEGYEVLREASGVFIMFAIDSSCTFNDVGSLAQLFNDEIPPGANLLFGAYYDDNLTDSINITVFVA